MRAAGWQVASLAISGRTPISRCRDEQRHDVTAQFGIRLDKPQTRALRLALRVDHGKQRACAILVGEVRQSRVFTRRVGRAHLGADQGLILRHHLEQI
jgi:hypothetical protein